MNVKLVQKIIIPTVGHFALEWLLLLAQKHIFYSVRKKEQYWSEFLFKKAVYYDDQGDSFKVNLASLAVQWVGEHAASKQQVWQSDSKCAAQAAVKK